MFVFAFIKLSLQISASDKQKSSSVFLEKGNFYELIATLKEYTGNDYITLAVKMPSGEFLPPIPSEQLFIGE